MDRAKAELKERIDRDRADLPRPSIYPGIFHTAKTTRTALIVPAPPILSIEKDRAAFLGFIYEYHWRSFAQSRQERSAYRTLVLDLSPVRELTLDAALVLTAEYHRRVLLSPGFKPTIDDKRWPPQVRSLLEQLGFYALVEAEGRTGPPSRFVPRGLRFVPFISGQKLAQGTARGLIESLEAAAGRDPDKHYIYAALVEAINNVQHHAYPTDATGPTELPSVSRWWAAGSFNPTDNVLQFAVYDQGVGIPKTLPRQLFFEAIRRFCPPEWTDADLIEGGVRFGRTRFRASRSQSSDRKSASGSSLGGRGNGLWAICHFIPQLSGSSVRIVSGYGEVVYSGGRAIVKTNHSNPFCGTLVQWTLKLPTAAPIGGLPA